jgi:hypothetical protein
MINLINSFGSPSKQSDKVNLEIRISKLTIFELKFDWSSKTLRLIIFNLGFERVPC